LLLPRCCSVLTLTLIFADCSPSKISYFLTFGFWYGAGVRVYGCSRWVLGGVLVDGSSSIELSSILVCNAIVCSSQGRARPQASFLKEKRETRNATTNDSFTLSWYWDIFYVSGRAFIVQIQVQIKKNLRPPDTWGPKHELGLFVPKPGPGSSAINSMKLYMK
jgi:hypothetical protein